MHYVIIGASAAGVSAAETLRQAEPHAQITIISKESEIGYSRCLCTYYLSGQIPREQMFFNNTLLNSTNTEIIAPAEVVSVDCNANTVTMAGGRTISFDKLLIASGASPVIPDIKGVQGPAVFTLRTLTDADSISEYIDSAKAAVILGDGLVSVTAAMALQTRGIKTSLVGIAPHILANFLDNASSAKLQQGMTEQGISFFLQQSITEIHREGAGKVTGVTITSGAALEADMVVIAAGVRPNTGFLQQVKTAANGALMVNEYLETSLPHVYAAGDAAQTFDFARNSTAWNPLWPNAVEQGRCAALNMAGVRKPYPGATNMNSLNIAGIPVICAGTANIDDPACESFVIAADDKVYQKLVFRNNSLVGYILLGKTEKAGVLTSLVAQKEITPTQKDNLLKGIFSYTQLSGIA